MPALANNLAAYFDGRIPECEAFVQWGSLPLCARTYLCSALPPLELVTSVRAVVLSAGQVLTVRDPSNLHILPGGRREAGEALRQTLRREVGEETGWTINDFQLLGITRFQHLGPRPEGYPFPYPDFLHLVYCARAVYYCPELREADGYELEAGFRAVAEVIDRISESERVFLQAALLYQRAVAQPSATTQYAGS